MRRARIGYAPWGASEYIAVAAAAAGLRKQAPEQLASALSQLGYGLCIVLTNCATTGLRMTLAAMRRLTPARSKVVVPAFCCPSVPRAVREIGLEPVAAPVTAELNLDLARLSPLLSNEVLAVVGVHMFCSPLDIAALRTLARVHDIMIIDDAAHDVGGGLGLGGDAGILSFNQSKTITGGSPNGGGALLVTNDALAEAVKALPDMGTAPSRLRYHAWFALDLAIDPFARRIPNHAARQFEVLESLLGDHERGNAYIAQTAAAAVLAQLSRLDHLRRRRTELIAAYARACAATGKFRMPQFEPGGYRSRMVVAWDNGPAASDIRPRMTVAGISTRELYSPWSPGAADCLGARFDRHLELPGDVRMRDNDVVAVLDRLGKLVASA